MQNHENSNKHMKRKLLLSNIIVVAMALAAAQTSNAQCVDPVDQGPCHTADSHPQRVSCQVNCLCPYDSTINQECYKSWTITIHTTDSSTSNWGCKEGTTYKKCDPYNANNCYWSVEQVTCPGLLPGDGCYPTLTYVTAGPGSRMVIHTDGC